MSTNNSPLKEFLQKHLKLVHLILFSIVIIFWISTSVVFYTRGLQQWLAEAPTTVKPIKNETATPIITLKPTITPTVSPLKIGEFYQININNKFNLKFSDSWEYHASDYQAADITQKDIIIPNYLHYLSKGCDSLKTCSDILFIKQFNVYKTDLDTFLYPQTGGSVKVTRTPASDKEVTILGNKITLEAYLREISDTYPHGGEPSETQETVTNSERLYFGSLVDYDTDIFTKQYIGTSIKSPDKPEEKTSVTEDFASIQQILENITK